MLPLRMDADSCSHRMAGDNLIHRWGHWLLLQRLERRLPNIYNGCGQLIDARPKKEVSGCWSFFIYVIIILYIRNYAN